MSKVLTVVKIWWLSILIILLTFFARLYVWIFYNNDKSRTTPVKIFKIQIAYLFYKDTILNLPKMWKSYASQLHILPRTQNVIA